jgi:hypothetical protein
MSAKWKTIGPQSLVWPVHDRIHRIDVATVAATDEWWPVRLPQAHKT